MTTLKSSLITLLLLLTSAVSSPAFAENSKAFGNYIVHYNAFRSDILTPEIAKAYSLTRRNNRMVVNITVQKKDGDASKPVKAKIEALPAT